MTVKKLILLTGIICLSLLQAVTSMAEEKYNWAQKIIMPIENTHIHHNETYNFGRYKFAHSPAKEGKIKSIITIEGKKSSILYTAPKKSLFEIFSTYKKFLKNKGFEIIFECEKGSCGEWNFHKVWYDLNPFESDSGWNNSAPITQGSGNYYIAAKKKIAGSETYVSIITNSGWWNHPIYRVDVAQISALDTKVIPASDIEKTMMAEGRAIFYGINFDSGKSSIKQDSEATLAQIAVFLKRASGQFYVVGHTDDQGSLSTNMQLSKDRATSIADFLIKKHSVPSSKLSAHGAGPLSPVASNLNEDGKALNRRVEIVQKLVARSKNSSRSTVDNIVDFNIKQDAALAAQGEGSAQESAPQVQPASQTTPQAVQNTQEENLIPVPKVTGKWMLSGYKILLKQGFKVRKKGKKFGKIRKQSPAANTRVRKGSTVTITIGR